MDHKGILTKVSSMLSIVSGKWDEAIQHYAGNAPFLGFHYQYNYVHETNLHTFYCHTVHVQCSYHLNSIIWQGFFQDLVQGVEMRCNGLLRGEKSYYLPQSKVYDKLGKPRIRLIVQSTISMHSMLMLGRFGGMPPPRKILENRCSEIEFENISESKYLL